MQFVIIARDGSDPGALDRRLTVRDEHIALGDRMVSEGQALYGGAILDDNDTMVGSVKVVDFASRAELDAYLATEPYVTGNVWQDIEVLPFRVGPSYTGRSQ